ncbi:hypothetical protein EF918_35505 [Streptomyces sp. WAC06614]|nr:hypothetical protein EF918_35505 [Streptomyces sp. WAC06614]
MVPGQRKRKRQQERERREWAERFGEGAGRWEAVFSTQDPDAWKAELQRLRREEPSIEWDTVRMDVFCGRLEHPNTYRLSVFVPYDTP